MANISTRLNLLAIPGSKTTELDGKNGKVKVVVIPIEYANLYDGQKGVYLDMIGFDLKNPRPDSKDTHLVKQSLPKEKQTEDMPILGSHVDWSKQGGNTTAAQPNNTASAKDDDDLPF